MKRQLISKLTITNPYPYNQTILLFKTTQTTLSIKIICARNKVLLTLKQRMKSLKVMIPVDKIVSFRMQTGSLNLTKPKLHSCN